MTTNPGPSPSRAKRPRVDRRQAIIDAAIALAGERPFDDVGVAEIAAHADVSHGLLFYYFGDKWGVTAEALRQLLDELRDFQSPRLVESTVRGRMEGFTRRHIQFLQDRRDAYVALLRGGAMAQPVVRGLIEEARRAGVDAIAEILGLSTPLTPMVDLALSSWVATLDVCTDHVLTRPDLGREEVVAWAVDRLFEAVGHPS